MFLAGIRGSVEGYEDALVWREPLVSLDSDRYLPSRRAWKAGDLEAVSVTQLEGFTEFSPPHIPIDERQVAIIAGRVYWRRLELTGLDPSLYGDWHKTGDAYIATGGLSLFDRLTVEIAERARRYFWAQLFKADIGTAESALRVLEQNPVFDRRSYHIYALLHAILAKDPDGLHVTVKMAQAELGADRDELIAAAARLWETFTDVDSVGRGVSDFDVIVKEMVNELAPTIDLFSNTRTSELLGRAAAMAATLERGLRQNSPVRIDVSGAAPGRHLWFPSLSILAQQIAHGQKEIQLVPYRGQVAETWDSDALVRSSASGALARSGLLRAIDRRRTNDVTSPQLPLDRAATPPRFIIERNTREELIVSAIHVAVDSVFVRDLIERTIPFWLRDAFPSAWVGFYTHAEKIVGELLKNVREHASLSRTPDAESHLHLSVTRGGGAHSTDRLWVRVSDNGVGIRRSLELRSQARLPEDLDRVMRELIEPGSDIVADQHVRKLTGAGDGISDVYVLCLELEQATGHPSQIFVYSASEGLGGDPNTRETVVAHARPGTRDLRVDINTSAPLAPGTVVMVELPTGSGYKIGKDEDDSARLEENEPLTLFDGTSSK